MLPAVPGRHRKERYMPNPQELESKFWKALKSDRTVMLGLDGVEDGHTRPMTAQIEGDAGGPIWFFAGTDNEIVQKLSSANRAILSFASKGHDLFATVHGSIHLDNDRAVIDRLWNPFVAAWYDGKDDPRLALLRVDPEKGQVWENASNLLAGVKMLLGIDPKKDYADKAAKVNLR
jgi:general stress protein 26